MGCLVGLYGYQALVVGHRLGLFPLLAERPRTVSEVCKALGVEPRPADVILTAAVSLGFLELRDDRYALTTVAEDYLLESSPTYFGFLFDLTAAQEDVLSISALERAVRTNTSQVFGGEHVFGCSRAGCTASVWERAWRGPTPSICQSTC